MVLNDRGLELLAVSWTFTALAILFVVLKLITRARILHALGWDDFFIFLSLALLVTCTGLFTYDVHPLGMGKHAVDISPKLVSDTIRINYIANPFGNMAYSFPNISVAILLNRLFPPNRLCTFGLFALAGLQCIIAGISCVLLFVQCLPTEYLWNPTIQATCLNAGTLSRYSYFVGSFTAATDMILGVVPITAFWKLQLPTKTKVGICCLMGCTLVAAICAVVKTTKLNTLENLADFSYATVDLVIWAIVEASVIIIAACMPTLRPFFNKIFKNDQHVSEGKGLFKSFGSFIRLLSTKSLIQLKPSANGSEKVSEDLSHHGIEWKIQQQKPEALNHSNSSTGAIWCITDIEMQSMYNGTEVLRAEV